MKTTDSFTLMKSQQREVVAAQGVFTSKSFHASVSVSWLDKDNKLYNFDFLLCEDDPEFREFFNNWGARKSAEIIAQGL